MAEPSVTIHPSTIDASTPVALRGDPTCAASNTNPCWQRRGQLGRSFATK
jgi:hypothetical protein